MGNSARILVIDHEPKVVHLLRELFSAEGYKVLAASDGEAAVQLAARELPTLVFIEMSLTGNLDAFEVIRRLRSFLDAPILVLAAFPEQEKVLKAYSAGADDCITKPFNPKILVARVHALLKRCQSAISASPEITCQDLTIFLARRQVHLNGVEIYLTEKEYDLLLELARHRDQVLDHAHLLGEVWGREFSQEVDYLRSYIHILRRKLEKKPSQPALIVSKPGVGYMLVSEKPGTAREQRDG